MRLDQLAIYGLAVARLTGLATADVITKPARERVRARFVGRRGEHAVTYLLGDDRTDGCAWCTSMWVAAAVAPAAYRWGRHPTMLIPAAALAMSQLTGMFGRVGR